MLAKRIQDTGRCYQFVKLAITYYAQTLFQLIVSFVKSNLRVSDGEGWFDFFL